MLCCFALFVCLTLLASFFLPSHLSLKHVHVYSPSPSYICLFVRDMVGWVILPFFSFLFLQASVLCTCSSMCTVNRQMSSLLSLHVSHVDARAHTPHHPLPPPPPPPPPLTHRRLRTQWTLLWSPVQSPAPAVETARTRRGRC